MNVNQIINMVIRQVMRRFINAGINKSMDAAGKGLAKRRKPDPGQIEADRAPERRG